MSACVFVIIRPSSMVERTKPKHELFAFTPAALQDVMDLARVLDSGSPANNAAQIPNCRVKCLFLIRHAAQGFGCQRGGMPRS